MRKAVRNHVVKEKKAGRLRKRRAKKRRDRSSKQKKNMREENDLNE